jgi:hypothetical protein
MTPSPGIKQENNVIFKNAKYDEEKNEYNVLIETLLLAFVIT